MHEYSLVSELLQRVSEAAQARQALSVQKVRLLIGEFAGVEADLLCWAFEAQRAGTVCAEAELLISKVAARWECPDCGAVIPPDGRLRCPDCDRPGQLVEGQQLVLERIEMLLPD
jgi:hydrogenase nickel incorporation protein HypA/HybF